MSQRTACVIAIALGAGAAPVHADELEVANNQPIEELAHRVDVRIADGVATYVVRRQLRNRGRRADELKLSIELPSGAAATGMRVRANGAWRTGELLDGAHAATRYAQVGGVGAGPASDLALLAWVSSTQLAMHVSPLAPGAVAVVEYTLTAPARYSGGHTWVTYPRAEPTARNALHRLADPVITVHAATPATIDGRDATGGRPVALPARVVVAPVRGVAPATHIGASAIDVPASQLALRPHAAVKLSLAIELANRDELAIELVTPSGARAPVYDDAIELPRPERAAGRWQLLVSGAAGAPGLIASWGLSIGGATFRAAAPAIIPSDLDTAAALALIRVAAPPEGAPWAARLGRVVASRERAFARLELDAAPRLSTLPIGAQVVFVLDASYSVDEPHLAAQVAILRAYLSHVPDAEVEVIAVRRTAQRLFGRFVPARDVDRLLGAAIQRGALALGNGSALDAGAALAASILAGRPGPHRVVLATDELVRDGGGAAALAALDALAPSAVVHVVVPSDAGGLAELVRDDDAPLAQLAQRHHGILARLDNVPEPLRELAPIALELVRPTRIEHLTGPQHFKLPSELREGAGIRIVDAELTAASAPHAVKLAGALWSDPIEIQAATSRAFSTAAAAFVFGAGQHADLEESGIRTLALAAGAISPLSSYLIAEPVLGDDPPQLGPDPSAFSWGTVGMSITGSSSHCIGASAIKTSPRPRPELRPLLDARACLQRHRPAAVTLAIETTRDEIVGVHIKSGRGPLADCLAEAAWAIRLDARFYVERDAYLLELGAN